MQLFCDSRNVYLIHGANCEWSSCFPIAKKNRTENRETRNLLLLPTAISTPNECADSNERELFSHVARLFCITNRVLCRRTCSEQTIATNIIVFIIWYTVFFSHSIINKCKYKLLRIRIHSEKTKS